MLNIDNTPLLNYDKNFDYSAFLPAVSFVYDSGAKTVTLTDATVLPAGHTLKSVNITIGDDFGNYAAGQITASGAAVTALLGVTAAALVTKNAADATVATKLQDKNDAQAAFDADNTNVALANALGYATAEYDAAVAAAADAQDAYDTAKAASDAAVAAADNIAVIDVSALNPVKGLDIATVVVTSKGFTANGSAYKIAAAGNIANWNKAESAAQQA